MKKYFLLFSLLICGMANIVAQTATPTYFDKNFKKTTDAKDARYEIFADTTTIQNVWYIGGANRRVYAQGKVYPADVLTFDGEVQFEGNRTRFYDRGQPLPLIFFDNYGGQLVRNAPSASMYYMAVGKDGTFYAYQFNRLFATGRIVDTAQLIRDGNYTEFNDEGRVAFVTKYKNGKIVPFIESTLDNYPQPYEILGVQRHMGTAFLSGTGLSYRNFIEKCRKTGADGVIGIRISTSQGFLFSQLVTISGTLIRLKNQ